MRSQDLDKKLADNIIAFRKALKLSQRKFALKANIDQSHINKIEKATMSVSLNNLQKISEAYNVPIKEFFEFSKQKETTYEKETLLLLSSISEEWKYKIILSLIREIKSVDVKKKSHSKSKKILRGKA